MARTAPANSFHFGAWLKDRIAEKELSAKGFAAQIGVDESTVHGWFKQASPNIRAYARPAVARALGLSREALEYHLENGRKGVPVAEAQRHFEQAARFVADSVHQQLKTRPIHDVKVSGPQMPAAFDLGIAAGGWVELTGEGWTPHLRQARGGFLIVKVAGDSMLPRWPQSEPVLFQILNLDEDQPVPGSDYFVIRNDNTGTFKRLISVQDEQFVLAPLNPKYHHELRVGAQEIVSIAVARYIVIEPAA